MVYIQCVCLTLTATDIEGGLRLTVAWANMVKIIKFYDL